MNEYECYPLMSKGGNGKFILYLVLYEFVQETTYTSLRDLMNLEGARSCVRTILGPLRCVTLVSSWVLILMISSYNFWSGMRW